MTIKMNDVQLHDIGEVSKQWGYVQSVATDKKRTERSVAVQCLSKSRGPLCSNAVPIEIQVLR